MRGTIATGRHVGIFARSLSGGGGVERVVLQLAGALAARGHRVDVILARAKGHFLEEMPAGVNLIELRTRPAILALPRLLPKPHTFRALFRASLFPGVAQVLGAIPALSRYISQHRPDALLAALDYANITAIIARELAGHDTRTIASVHNHMTSAVANAQRAHLRRVIPLVQQFYPAADKIVCVSHGVADDLKKITGLKSAHFATIYNPVVTDRIEPLARLPSAHPWLDDEQIPVVLGVGKLRRQKDFETLIRAFAHAHARQAVRLIILGDGPELATLQQLSRDLGVAKDVDFAGFNPNPYAFMSRAAVFVLSSAWEGFGNVLVEAMACGCPVISTDCPSGPSEILAKGIYGKLVPVGDHERMAEAICARLERAGDTVRAKARAFEFSSEISAAHYEQVLFPNALD